MKGAERTHAMMFFHEVAVLRKRRHLFDAAGISQ
jgi:hypothetical protein